MFKKIFLLFAVLFPLTALAQKFGIVDTEPVITALPEYTQVTTQLTETSRRYEEEFGKLQDEVNQLMTAYQTIAEDANTPQSIKERRAQELQEKMNRMDQFRNTAQQDLSRLQEQLMAPVVQKFNDAVKSVGAEGGYTFIFPNEPTLFLYTGTEVVNVTDAVKAKLGIQ